MRNVKFEKHISTTTSSHRTAKTRILSSNAWYAWKQAECTCFPPPPAFCELTHYIILQLILHCPIPEYVNNKSVVAVVLSRCPRVIQHFSTTVFPATRFTRGVSRTTDSVLQECCYSSINPGAPEAVKGRVFLATKGHIYRGHKATIGPTTP